MKRHKLRGIQKQDRNIQPTPEGEKTVNRGRQRNDRMELSDKDIKTKFLRSE